MCSDDAATSSPQLSADDCLFFVDRALDQMVAIVTELGDTTANRSPDLPGANSPYQLLTHCLGVCEYWGGAMIAGRAVDRDRAAEFTAEGPVEPLAQRAQAAKAQFRRDVANLHSTAPTAATLPKHWNPTKAERTYTQGEALVHVVEELCQHLGHLEITRDILRAN